MCVRVWGGGGVLSFIYIYMKIPKKILKLKDFEPPKNGLSLLCVKISESPPPHPASMLVHEATVCRSVSFIWAS